MCERACAGSITRPVRSHAWCAGQSQPPMHLSMFLEVTDPRAASDDWSAFVSHRLAVVNQRDDVKSLAKESQNRYSRAAKDWGACLDHWPPAGGGRVGVAGRCEAVICLPAFVLSL